MCVKSCTGLTLNSFAKGLVADRAAAAVVGWSSEHVECVTGAVVNLGGDIAVRSFTIRVGIEDPMRSYDNEPPLCVVKVQGGGIATSGASRRPIVIGGHPFSHLIDPSTCRPVVGGPAAVTVIGSSAAEADALATIVAVTGQASADHAVAIINDSSQITMTLKFIEHVVA